MKRALLFIVLYFSFFIPAQAQTKVLVFSKTAGFRHDSIPAGKQAITQLGKENGFAVDTTEKAGMFTDSILRKYNAVVFLSTTGDVLNQHQQAAFERYIRAGGGFMGIHAATDCEYHWPWYGELVGAYLRNHPEIQPAKLIVHNRTHPGTAHLPQIWVRSDEWYNFRQAPGSEVNILISIDEGSYEGGTHGNRHPMAWYHEYDGGRAFYTGLGHTIESFSEPDFLKHILGGIQYAIGNGAGPDYSKIKNPNVPDEDRFTKTLLAGGIFDEPTEMAILPNLDILIAQRKGEVMWYENATKKVTQVAKFDLYHESGVEGVNAEEGLMGITADPDFAKNNYIYMYYAPLDSAVNRLSRFVFRDGKLDLKTEKKILDVGTTRKICCHTGGSLAFGPDGNLYLSTGDNTTPFNQPNSKYVLAGFAPIDNRTGFEQYDGRRSSSNTNDLRGKILRIKIHPDGSYSIPEGNLFAPGTAKTRPEIYVMGTRNPYRISIDRKTGFVYWGDLGPDAAHDKPEEKGSRGYDELNQARKAGYFGYPLFIGNNYPYRQFNYETGAVGDFFDPKKPLNLSKNNTGLVELPPANPAFIWYPYAASPDFPEVGSGARSAMAGPVYHPEFYPKATRYPDYYDGKLLFYEWIRGWMKMVTMDGEGNFENMEPFMEKTLFKNAIDVEVGPDGRLYVLEYGDGWFSKNPDGGLSRIDYNGGNRAPKARVNVSNLSGSIPFTVKADARGSVDPDGDPISYTWQFGDVVQKPSTAPNASFTFRKPGEFPVYVTVTDTKGASTKSEVIKVYAGNEAPVVDVKLDAGNKFYFPGVPVPYTVSVQDKEDGSTETGDIDQKSVYVKVDYLSGADKAQVVGHQVTTPIMEGKNLAASLDCMACHKEVERSVGPSFKIVGAKYEKDPKARAYLTNKIIYGGGGVWGEMTMSARPDLKPEEAGLIVDWILGLNKKEAASLPAKGTIVPSEKDMGAGNLMQITAKYTDRGGKDTKPLTSVGVVKLKSALVNVTNRDTAAGVEIESWNDIHAAFLNLSVGENGWIGFDNIDLDGIKAIELGYAIPTGLKKGYVVSWYQDNPGPNGAKIAELKLESAQRTTFGKIEVPVRNVKQGDHKLFLTIERIDKEEANRLAIISMRFVPANQVSSVSDWNRVGRVFGGLLLIIFVTGINMVRNKKKPERNKPPALY